MGGSEESTKKCSSNLIIITHLKQPLSGYKSLMTGLEICVGWF